jgi:hypothetical protein
MEMVKTALFAMVLAGAAAGADFSLAIGNPVAVAFSDGEAKGLVKKDAGMAVRGENCADPAKVQITGVAEGMVNGARRSVPVRVIPASAAGAFAVAHDWPVEGAWVVNLTGHCGASTASAVVPFGPGGFRREASKFFPRAATAAEVELALKTLAGGAQ